MKKIIAVLLVAFASPALASVSCHDMGLVAAKMMELRQAGVPYQNVAAVFPEDDPDMYRMFKVLADTAYKHQIYKRADTVTAVIQDYSESVRTICYENR